MTGVIHLAQMEKEYNSMVMGIHQYCKIATHVNIDLNPLGKRMLYQFQSKLNTNDEKRVVKTGRKLTTVEHELYGKSEQLRYVKGPNEPIYPIENSFIPLAEQYLHLSSELSKLNAKKKALENDRDEIKLQFGTVLGQGTEGKMDLGDGHYYAVSYKPVSRLKADIDALQAFFPEAFSACVQEEPEAYRLFSIKEKDDRGRLVRNR